MKTTAAVLLLALSLALVASAQDAPADSRKSDAQPAASSLGDISGMYSFLREGEFIQIDLEDDGRVTGFVSRYGDLDSDKDAFLDHMFDKATLVGNKLNFTTRTVHGVSFEFKGTVERGDAKTPGAEGYYVLKGKLTETSTDPDKKAAARSRDVVFKSFPSDIDSPPARKKD